MTAHGVIRKGANERRHVPNVVMDKIKRPTDERIYNNDSNWNQK